MLRLLLTFGVAWIIVWLLLETLQAMNWKQRWSLIKTLTYAGTVATIAAVALGATVLLF